jgi:hypothetical protein
MLELFNDYPVMITAEEVQNYLNIDIAEFKNSELLNDAHKHIYDFLIYPTFNADIKERIIKQYKNDLEKPLKKALLSQIKYLSENGNIGEWNGIIESSSSVGTKDSQELLTKIIAPEVINILKGAKIDLLYSGE